MKLFDIVEKDGEENIIISITSPGNVIETMPLNDFVIRNRCIKVEDRTLTLYDFIEEEKEKIRISSCINR